MVKKRYKKRDLLYLAELTLEISILEDKCLNGGISLSDFDQYDKLKLAKSKLLKKLKS